MGRRCGVFLVLLAAGAAWADPGSEAEVDAALRRAVASYILEPHRPAETGARDFFDFAAYLPGFANRPFDGGETAVPSYSLRGLPDPGLSRYVCVLLDGIPVAPLHYARTDLTFMPVTIERIESVTLETGVDGMLLASNTLGGAIDFRTPAIPETPIARLRSALGSQTFRSTLVTAGGTWGRLGVLGTISDVGGHGFRAESTFSQSDLSVKFSYDLGETRRITGSASYMDDQHPVAGGRTTSLYRTSPNGTSRPEDYVSADRVLFRFAYRSGAEGEAWWEAFASGSRTHRKLHAQRPEFGTPDMIEDWHDDNHHAEIGVRGELPLELFGMRHRFRGAVRHFREWLPRWERRLGPYPQGGNNFIGDGNYKARAISLFVADAIEPTPRLRIEPGLRAEWILRAHGEDSMAGWSFEYDDAIFLPSVRGSWAVTDRFVIFGGYFEGFRMPQLEALVTDPDVAVERSRTFEAGARGRAECGVYGSLVGWTAEYRDVADLSTGTYANLGRVRATGGDLVLGWDLGETWDRVEGLDVSVTLSRQNSELSDGNRVPFTWETKASWQMRYRRGRWSAFLGGSYVGDSFSDAANTAVSNPEGTVGLNPSHRSVDLRVTRRFELNHGGGIDVAFGATNLLDDQWFVHSDGGFFGGGRVVAPPRRGYFMVSLDLAW